MMKNTVLHCEHDPEKQAFIFECSGDALKIAFMLGVTMARILNGIPAAMREPFRQVFEGGWESETKGENHGKTETPAGDSQSD